MKIHFYNFSNKVIAPLREIHTLLPSIALSAEPPTYSSDMATALEVTEGDMLEKDLKKLAQMLYDVSLRQYGEAEARRYADAILEAHKVRQKKMKTKTDFQRLVLYNKTVKAGLELVRSYIRGNLISQEMHRINAFRRDSLLKFHFLNIKNDNAGALNEDAVHDFMNVVSEDAFSGMPICTEQMVQPFAVAGMEQAPGAGWFERGMLRLPMFELPGFLAFKRKKYELLREELQPELDGWWNALLETVPALAPLPFSEEGFPALKEKVMSMLAAAAEALNRKMKDSIYLKQLANDEYGEYVSTFSFVMTRRVTLLEAYHLADQLQAEALQTLKDYYTNRNTAGNTVCFLLHELPSYPPKRQYGKGDEHMLGEMWDESMTE